MSIASRSALFTAITFLGASFAQVSAAADYLYTATTADPVRISGQVSAGSFLWKCSGRACKISGPWPVPGIEACAALAQKVGRIASYGHSMRQLNKSQLAQCNSALGTAPVDVPPISTKIGDQTKTGPKTVPGPKVDEKPLIGALGPQIQDFRATAGCPYPNRRDSLGLSYRVASAPDGAAIAAIELLQVLDNGTTRTVFVTPGSDGRSVQFSATKIVDDGAASDVARYMLRATDVRRRKSTKLVPSPYWPGVARLELEPRFTVQRDGSQFRYLIPYTLHNGAPGAAPQPSIQFRGSSSPISADIVGTGSLSTYYSDGREGWWGSYSGRNFYEVNSGRIGFTSRQAVMANGQLEMPGFQDSVIRTIRDWRIQVRIPLSYPEGCSGSSSSITATLSGQVNRPSASASEDAPLNGYWYDIPCNCQEPYDDDLSHTRAFTSRIRACMANERGAALMCGMSASMLNPAGAAGRSCTMGGIPVRSGSGPLSCYAVPGSIRILENNR